jgi:hypothetical protein
MTRLEIQINVNDNEYLLKLPEFLKAVNRLGGYVVDQARNVLVEKGKVVTGALSDSLGYSVEETEDGLTLSFGADVPYWDYVEQGVKGAASSEKAPDSEYQFGSGTGEKGALKPAIRKWITDKGISNQTWRDKRGRFLSYDAMSQRIARSVYLTGIRPTGYYQLAMQQTEKEASRSLTFAMNRDIDVFFEQNFSKDYTIEIDIG